MRTIRRRTSSYLPLLLSFLLSSPQGICFFFCAPSTLSSRPKRHSFTVTHSGETCFCAPAHVTGQPRTRFEGAGLQPSRQGPPQIRLQPLRGMPPPMHVGAETALSATTPSAVSRENKVVVEKPGQQVSPLRFASVEMTMLWWEGRDSRSPTGRGPRQAVLLSLPERGEAMTTRKTNPTPTASATL
jgi:hypothetical protein